jgi:sugar/nucleoside kinase (ribokinase family)
MLLAAGSPAADARVLVVGDLNPDLVLAGDVVPRFGQAEQLLDSATTVIGGSAGITAHGLARLGRPVSLVAAIGSDVFGSTVSGALADAGVDTRQLVVRSEVATGLTVPTLTAAEVRAAFAGASNSGLRHVHVCALFLQPVLLAGLPDLLREIRASGMSTSLDTNHDPAGRWAGIEALLPHLDLLLPNRGEALALSEALTGTPARTLTDACRSLAGRGPLVVAKDGAAGARAVDPAGVVTRAPGRPVDVVDTTGAGDTFNAAFLDAWLSRLSMAECLHRGVAAGAHSVAGAGGTATQPTLDLLLRSART